VADAAPAREQASLQESLEALGQLATGKVDLRKTLISVAELAVHAVAGADGAGLTLLQLEHPDVLVATADFVTEVDAVQYRLGQGPSISAVAEGRTVQSPSLGGDGRWLQFGSTVARLNVHSALSLPLITPDGLIGAMNIYARKKRAFTPGAVACGQRFAVPAAIAVQNALVLSDARQLTVELRSGLTNRATIERAVGIMMSRGSTADEAMGRLRQLSRSTHTLLHTVAETVVDQAVRRAVSRNLKPT
jgi:GAF domain-containing protein